MRLFLVHVILVTMTTTCLGAWFEEAVYEDEPSKRNDVTLTDRRHLLLSVLVNLNKLYRDRPRDENLDENEADDVDKTSLTDIDLMSALKGEGPVQYNLHTALVTGDDVRSQPSKRGRYGLSGVLPPLGELCRAMHIGGCSHSRHKR